MNMGYAAKKEAEFRGVGQGHRRFKTTVQYDGTGFYGFQRQAKGRTVQQVLESALGAYLGHKVTIRGAGRTDSGVHAKGQVISFVSETKTPTNRIHLGLLEFLPKDVLVGMCEEVPISFDPLKEAKEKTYCYRFSRGFKGDIMMSRYSVAFYGHLDFDLMQDESKYILGRHDFHNFRAKGSSSLTTVRNVFRAEWVKKDPGPREIWEFWVSGDGFLYKMVRLIAGTLIDVGRGRFCQGKIREALISPGNVQIGKCLPGKGLCLEEIKFS